MKVLLKIILLFAVVPSIIVLSLYSLDQNGFFNLNEIEINLVSNQDQIVYSKPKLEEIKQNLLIFKNQSLFKISINRISAFFKKEPWIKEFRINRHWPDKVTIEVEPYKLMYLLYSDSKASLGKINPVTDEGVVLSDTPLQQVPDLTIVKSDMILRDEKKRKKIIELIKSLPAEGNLSHKVISEVGFDKQDGYWVEITKSALRVKLGDGQFAVKSARASQVIDYLDQRDLKARVIDANLSKKVLVRLQQTP